jgi:hypothetical protein
MIALGLVASLLVVVAPGMAFAQLCDSDSDCGCGEVCAFFDCVSGCFSDSRCSVGQDCIAGSCFSCGGHNEPACPTGGRCNGTQSNECDLWKNRGTLGGFTGCQNCGGTGQLPCYVPGFFPIPGVLEAYTSPPNVACQQYRTPDAGGASCVTCGAPAQPICTRQQSPPLDDLCQPAYSPITDEGGGGDPTCYACGGDGEFTCTHSAQPRCDATMDEFSLDPVRPVVVQGIQDALPAFVESQLPPGTLDQIDACWLPDLPSFARDAPVSWPTTRPPPGPRTIIQIHGRNGGGFSEAPSSAALGARNVIRYRVDYNAEAEQPFPFRLWAWDERGQPYVIYEELLDGQPISATNYGYTLDGVAAFVYRALLRVPVHGEIILQGQSMGGYVIKDTLYHYHDQLRFRGRPINEMVFTSHPHFGIVLDPYEYTPFLCSGLAERYTDDGPLGIAQDCKSGRWMMAWNDSLARIDLLEYPHVKWGTGTGDCDLSNPSSACVCQPSDPPTCTDPTIEVPPPGSLTEGFEPPGFVGWQNLDGDTLFNTDSGIGIDTYDSFWMDQLAFDVVGIGDCPHVTECGVSAMQAVDPDLYTDGVVCGDLTGEAAIDASDVALLRQSLAALTELSLEETRRCSVSFGGPECDLTDYAHLARALANDASPTPIGPGLQQTCAAAADLARGLVAYWPFEPTLGTGLNHAASGSTFDAAVAGSVSAVPGVLGAAGGFDAAGDYLAVGNAVAEQGLRPYAQFSAQAWIRPTGQAGVADVFLNKEGEVEIARFNDGSIRYAIAPAWSWIDTGLFAPADAWSHVVLVLDALAAPADPPDPNSPLLAPYRFFDGEVRAYVNGVEVVDAWTDGEVGDIHPTLNELRVGARQQSGDRFLGSLDEVAIWQRPLSPYEVGLLYNAGAGQPLGEAPFEPTPLTPRIWFDASDAATVSAAAGQVASWLDRSGSGFHLSPVTTSPTWVQASKNGLPTVRFDSSADVLCSPATPLLALPTAVTIAIVARNDARRDYNGLFSVRASTAVHANLELYWQVGSSGSGNLVYFVNRNQTGAGGIATNNAGPAAGSYYLASITVDDATLSSALRVSPSSSAAGGYWLPAAANRVCVGLGYGATIAPNALDGDVAELLVFDRALSAAERASLETYLRRKWGL